MSLDGKTALITGATSGIGYAIAATLAENNCNVVVNGFSSPTEIADVVAHFSSLGSGKAVYCASDLTKVSDIEALVHCAEENFGEIDILVNNAGIQHVDPIEAFPPEKWDAIMAINLSAAFHLIRLGLPVMRKKGWGRIINIASTHGLVASTNKAAYVAAKHGLIGLTQVVALETAVENITCNAICPGWVKTPLVEKQINDLASEQGISIEKATLSLLAEKQPSHQFVNPKDIGQLVVFLSGEAASNITGSSLAIDGGWLAQ